MKKIFSLPLVYKVEHNDMVDLFTYSAKTHQHELFGTFKQKDVTTLRNGEIVCREDGGKQRYFVIQDFGSTVYTGLEVLNYEESLERIVFEKKKDEWYYQNYDDNRIMADVFLGKRIIPRVFLKEGEKKFVFHTNNFDFIAYEFSDYEVSKETFKLHRGSFFEEVKAEVIKISRNDEKTVRFFRLNSFSENGDVVFKGKKYKTDFNKVRDYVETT